VERTHLTVEPETAGAIAHAFTTSRMRHVHGRRDRHQRQDFQRRVARPGAVARGEPAAVIGTLGVGVFRPRGEVEFDVTGYTTPDAVLLARTWPPARAGRGALAIEVSSIAWSRAVWPACTSTWPCSPT
jgi:UDP-N-acetylmuramoyl-L-alanyl-D-glutamate--2,6-diaminopimelate ligase